MKDVGGFFGVGLFEVFEIFAVEVRVAPLLAQLHVIVERVRFPQVPCGLESGGSRYAL